MNCSMSNVTMTGRDGSISTLEQVTPPSLPTPFRHDHVEDPSPQKDLTVLLSFKIFSSNNTSRPRAFSVRGPRVDLPALHCEHQSDLSEWIGFPATATGEASRIQNDH